MTSLTYPLTVNNGKLVTTSSYPEIVKQAILSAIMTKQEERILVPEYGTTELIFTTYLPQTLLGINQAIKDGIQDLPDVLFDTYGYISDAGTLVLTVSYTVEELTDSLEIILEFLRQ